MGGWGMDGAFRIIHSCTVAHTVKGGGMIWYGAGHVQVRSYQVGWGWHICDASCYLMSCRLGAVARKCVALSSHVMKGCLNPFFHDNKYFDISSAHRFTLVIRIYLYTKTYMYIVYYILKILPDW